MNASEAMNLALLRLLDHDQVPPCGERDAPDPCSEEPDERAAAATRCAGCPIAGECADLGDEIKARHHVFGGRDRTRTPGRPTKEKAA